MKNHSQIALRSFWTLLFVSYAAGMAGETRIIDPTSSLITVRVYKSGFFSFLAHDHLIEARGLKGSAETNGSSGVEFTLNARELKVVDPGVSEKERAEIQQAMEEKVLELGRYPEIRFRSTSVSSLAADRWQVKGDLLLHGQTVPVAFVVQESKGRFRGRTTLRQTDFGIEPIRIAAGTIKVKDEITIEFDVGMTGSN
jgi:polyisoprenoid-binding protein YceI